MSVKITCCLCGKDAGKYGHNAQPLAQGRCCDSCNTAVIYERLTQAMKQDGSL